jgi:glycosyltransferase involved in cell wall biosynthesis
LSDETGAELKVPQDDVSMTPQPAPARSTAPRKVWMFEPLVQHYRLPVFDSLRERAQGRYDFTLFGTLENGRAMGGSSRPYLRESRQRWVRKCGINFLEWRDAEERVRSERPDVLIMTSNVRCLSAWRLPRLCHEYGGHIVGWTKVHAHGLPTILERPIRGNFYRRYDRMLIYGQRSFEELTGYGYPSAHAHVFRNTIDTRRIFEEGDALRTRGKALLASAGLSKRRVLLCIGKMQSQKRLDDLLDAWPALRALDEQLSLVVVGSGPLLESYRERAARVDAERVHVIGHVPEGDDYAWMSIADIFVVPGAVGLAINQALAFGCPTLVADEPGADSEIIVHDETGWRYPPGDTDALIANIRAILTNTDDTRKISQQGREKVRSDVTIEHMVDVIDGVLTELLAQSDQRP